MTLYETISARRQVRKFNSTPLEQQTLDDILKVVREAEQLDGQQARFEIASANAITGGAVAPHYILSYCDHTNAGKANVGYVLQKADLYIQSLLLGSGWFMGPKPADSDKNFCIALAFGRTSIPMRESPDEFKRLPIEDISPSDNTVAQAVRLAPSSMNSQPWKLDFEDGKVIIHDSGRGLMRVVLRDKLNKIDTGIAARHAVTALEHDGKRIIAARANENGKAFQIEISYE